MTQNNLEARLRALVLEYGFEQVHKHLHDIQTFKPDLMQSQQSLVPSNEKENIQTSSRKPKVTAPEYIAKMQLLPEKERTVAEIADKFQEKTFLPTFRDIEHFCEANSIDVPASRARASAVPRIFKFIASMEVDDIQNMLNEGMFSGPSRLGPIADAIRRNGRARATSSKLSVAVQADNTRAPEESRA